jgi:hypothetical protein
LSEEQKKGRLFWDVQVVYAGSIAIVGPTYSGVIDTPPATGSRPSKAATFMVAMPAYAHFGIVICTLPE